MLGFLAGRYAARPGIAYEIWNEPNQVTFWNSPSGPNAMLYGWMLRAAYARIKTAAPGATVLGGSIAFNDPNYLDDMYTLGGVAGSFDALALHPYSLGNSPDAMADAYHSFSLAIESMSQVMAARGEAGKPIWITEVGWSTTLVSDATRAGYYRRAVELVRGWPQVAALIAYTLRQDDDAQYGLFTPEGNATASWTAYVQAAAVPNSSSSYPSGGVDAPPEGGAVVGSTTVSGWALDAGAVTGTGVERVQVYLDGVHRGDAVYGQSRPDIGAAYGARFATSGYSYVLDLHGAAAGSHTIEVRARSTVTGADTAYIRSIIAAPSATSYPSGGVDAPPEGGAVVGSTTVSGWALDAGATTGTGVDRVQVYLDGVYRGDAVYGQGRPDIGAAYGARFAPSGYSYLLNLAGVAAGSHTIEVRARSTVTGADTAYIRSIIAAPSATSYPSGGVDAPPEGGAVVGSTTVSGVGAGRGSDNRDAEWTASRCTWTGCTAATRSTARAAQTSEQRTARGSRHLDTATC